MKDIQNRILVVDAFGIEKRVIFCVLIHPFILLIRYIAYKIDL